jgi:hypothetical protein
MLLYRKIISPLKMNKKGVEWASWQFIVVALLIFFAGFALIYFLMSLRGRIGL